MSQKSAAELAWFLRNADLVLNDMAQRPGPSGQWLYWDTADVRGALVGMADFYDRGGAFNESAFTSRITLVRCLMSARWFGRINMLRPHHAEFVNGLNQLFVSNQTPTPPGGPVQFFRDSLSKTLTAGEGNAEITLRSFENLVKGQIASAERLFAAVQSVELWVERLKQWKVSRLLASDEEDEFDFKKTILSEEFVQLRTYLNKNRPDVPINNFTDSMALCHLAHKLNDALRHDRPLPLFFASDTHLRTAASAVKKSKFLAYESASGETVSVIRDADYFLMRASLWPLKDSSPGSYESVTDPLGTLQEMRDEVRRSVGTASEQELASSGQIHTIRDALASGIDELNRIWFLDRVWLPSAPRSMVTATERYMKETRRLLDEPSRKQLRHYIDELTKEVDQSARELSLIHRTWNGIEEKASELRDRYTQGGGKIPSAGKLSGLVRFGLPKEVEDKIDAILRRLMDADEDERKKAVAFITTQGIAQSQDSSIDYQSVGALTGVLWILGLPDMVQTAARAILADAREDSAPPSWLMMLYCAALLERQSSKGRGAVRQFMMDLETRATGVGAVSERLQAMIALGYLNFHLWLREGGLTFWQARARTTHSGVTIHLKSGLWEESITWVDKALELASPGSARYVYALNQHVFYNTEGGQDATFRLIARRAQELLSFRSDQELWRYNFTDTLAHYFHRAALQASEPDATRLWNLAFRYADDAAREGVGDKEIEIYQGILATEARQNNS